MTKKSLISLICFGIFKIIDEKLERKRYKKEQREQIKISYWLNKIYKEKNFQNSNKLVETKLC